MSNSRPEATRAPRYVIEPIDTPEGFTAAKRIRERVFVDEQKIPAHLDDDGFDEVAHHVLCRLEGAPVGTGRLVVVEPGVGVLARIAVVPEHRGRGLGRRLVGRLETMARDLGVRELSLHPHAHLESFYQTLGYETVAGTSLVGEHHLITMAKGIGPPTPRP